MMNPYTDNSYFDPLDERTRSREILENEGLKDVGQAQQWSVSRLKNEKNYANEPLLDAAVRKLNSVQAALDDTHRSYKAEITVIQTALARAEEERRCTCLHDYYEGDHHYRFCPASSESGQGRLRAQLKAATERAEVAEAADLVWVSDYGGNVSLNLRIEELMGKLETALDERDIERVHNRRLRQDCAAAERRVEELVEYTEKVNAQIDQTEKAQIQRPWPMSWVTRHDPPEADVKPATP